MLRGVLGMNISMWRAGKVNVQIHSESVPSPSPGSQVFVQLQVHAVSSGCSVSGGHGGEEAMLVSFMVVSHSYLEGGFFLNAN